MHGRRTRSIFQNNVEQRRSEDNVVNENGRQLLKICKTVNFFILNGRISNDPECKFTCRTSQGQSVVDHFIVDGKHCRKTSICSKLVS